jgi:hypothetical protein
MSGAARRQWRARAWVRASALCRADALRGASAAQRQRAKAAAPQSPAGAGTWPAPSTEPGRGGGGGGLPGALPEPGRGVGRGGAHLVHLLQPRPQVPQGQALRRHVDLEAASRARDDAGALQQEGPHAHGAQQALARVAGARLLLPRRAGRWPRVGR